MIDSICLKHISTELTEAKLLNLGAIAKAGRRNPIWIVKPASDDSTLPSITISKTPVSIFHVFVERSIPMVLYGHNARLPSTEADIHRGIESICEYTQKRLDIKFEAESVRFAKLHLTRDYYIGDAVNNAVFALFDKRLRYFPKRNIAADEASASTLYFNCLSPKRNSVICIYPNRPKFLPGKARLRH